MKYTKLILIAAALVAVAYTACGDNPMWNMNNIFRPDDDTTLLEVKAAAPTDLTFCKAHIGKDVCCNYAGYEAVKAKWLAAKTKMKDARDARLKLYND